MSIDSEYQLKPGDVIRVEDDKMVFSPGESMPAANIDETQFMRLRILPSDTFLILESLSPIAQYPDLESWYVLLSNGQKGSITFKRSKSTIVVSSDD